MRIGPILLLVIQGCGWTGVLGCGAMPGRPPDIQVIPDLSVVFDFSRTDTAAGDQAMALPDLTRPPENDLSAADRTVPGDATVTVVDASVPGDAPMPADAGIADLTSAPPDLSPLTYLGQTFAFTTGAGQIALGVVDSMGQGSQGGTTPSGQTVSVITQTYPRGASASVHLVYSVNDPTVAMPDMGMARDLVMSFDRQVGNNEQWYAIIPTQPSGTRVYFYVYAIPHAGLMLYDPTNFNHLTYLSQ